MIENGGGKKHMERTEGGKDEERVVGPGNGAADGKDGAGGLRGLVSARDREWSQSRHR